jgi:hypothetical protein
MGAIKFPLSFSQIPITRIYASGKIVPYDWCAPDNTTKLFTFSIPHNPGDNTIYLLITETVQFEKAQSKYLSAENTNNIACLKMKTENQPYKFYKLTLVSEKPVEAKDPLYHWIIEEQTLPAGKIPDDAVTICYDATSIESISGGSEYELPTIYLKQDLSESALQKLTNNILLSSLDSDAIHAPIHQEVQQRKYLNIVTSAA